MRAALALALALAACGSAPFLGTWRFERGEASVVCDGGSNPATYLLGPFRIDEGADGTLVTDYVSGCPLALDARGDSAQLADEAACHARLLPGDAGVPSVEAVEKVRTLTFERLGNEALEVAYQATTVASEASCSERASGVARLFP